MLQIKFNAALAKTLQKDFFGFDVKYTFNALFCNKNKNYVDLGNAKMLANNN